MDMLIDAILNGFMFYGVAFLIGPFCAVAFKTFKWMTK